MMGKGGCVRLLWTGATAAGAAARDWFGWLVLLWAASMAMDYAVGTLAALKRRNWNSAAAREGLWHKGGMILVVLVAAMTDLAVSLLLRTGMARLPFDRSVVLTATAMSWYTLTELGSTLENVTRITSRVPPWLTRVLRRAADAVDDAGDELAPGKGADRDA